jgi:type IV pilus assembly protein PilY1
MPYLLYRLLIKTLIAGLAGMTSFTTAYAAISQLPLFLTTAYKPNVMLMLDDSGSMWNVVPDTPYDPNATYLANCPSSRILGGGVEPPAMPSSSTSYWLQVSSGVAMVDHRNAFGITVNLYTFGTGIGQRCFDPALRYNAKLETNALVDAVYTGHYLNWYFGNSPTYTTAATFGSGAKRKPGTQSRLEIAKTAAKNLVDSLGNVRLGLSTYDNNLDGVGGDLLEIIGDLDATKKTNVKSKIDALNYDLYTPLAETLAVAPHLTVVTLPLPFPVVVSA